MIAARSPGGSKLPLISPLHRHKMPHPSVTPEMTPPLYKPETGEKEDTAMASNSLGRVVGRLAAAAGLAIAMSACGMALEDPPRAMYGTAEWSDAWQVTCSDVNPSGTQPQKLGAEHVDNDCHQYEVAQQMRYHQPRLASSQSQ